MAGWMKTPLGTEVNLGPGHIVLDGVPAVRERGTVAPPPFFYAHVYFGQSPISATAELLYIHCVIAVCTTSEFAVITRKL